DGSVVKVDFYNGTVLLGTQNTSPYAFTWSNVATGEYVLVAVVTDDGGLVSRDTVNVSVKNFSGAPTVSITSPVTNSSVKAPATITINATANDAHGSVSKVEFYNGSALLGTDSISPYSFVWSNVAAGNYV